MKLLHRALIVFKPTELQSQEEYRLISFVNGEERRESFQENLTQKFSPPLSIPRTSNRTRNIDRQGASDGFLFCGRTSATMAVPLTPDGSQKYLAEFILSKPEELAHTVNAGLGWFAMEQRTQHSKLIQHFQLRFRESELFSANHSSSRGSGRLKRRPHNGLHSGSNCSRHCAIIRLKGFLYFVFSLRELRSKSVQNSLDEERCVRTHTENTSQ